MNPDTSHPKTDGEKQWIDEIIGKGPADPDMQGYPGEDDEPEPVESDIA